MASRIVMNESTKCRSGREADRSVGIGPSRRGGKMPRAFSDDEREAAEDDGNVMVPAREGTTFEVIESELAFKVFVGALRSPALLDDTHDLLLAHAARKRSQDELCRLRLPVGPFDHEPEWLAIRRVDPVLVSDLHPVK